MQKKIGAILLIAGTCIGSGMIALPLVLAKLGLVPSILLMILIWSVTYYTSLVNLELNLQAGEGLPLGQLGRRFSGKIAEAIGVVSLKLLSYSLLAVFIYGAASILQQLIASHEGVTYSFNWIATWLTIGIAVILMFSIKLIDYINRLLFIGLMAIVMVLIIGLAVSIEWHNLPLLGAKYSDLNAWWAVIPVVFTSFGFQVIFHTLTNYCHKNTRMLRQAFFWGSLIPAIVYIVWTSSILSVVYHERPDFYGQMVEGKAEVGGLIQVLSGIAKWESVQLLVWWISLLAIATSVLGVGIGLCDSLKRSIARYVSHPNLRGFFASLLAIVPAYLAVIFIPNAFISVLGFAGMILAVIAILLPIYLFGKIENKTLFFHELTHKPLLVFSLAIALLIIASELIHLFLSR
jgi:tyrosine-specific transport protein